MTVVVSSGAAPPRRRPRIFNPNTIYVGVGANPFSPVVVFTLADGNDYAYYYAQGTPYADALREVDILAKSPPTGYVGATGGVFYNRTVRPQAVLKFLA